jgi:SAM-dependent methyltransferase
MTRLLGRLAAVGALIAIGAIVLRHVRRGLGRTVAGGILVRNAGAYDAITRRLLDSFFRPIARDVAATAPAEGTVLDVGCGPGHLSVRLAAGHGLHVVGIDLDPAMIERARANAERAGAGSLATFAVADVAALPFADASFDVVVSTLSMHHWEDASAGLAEIGRVLAPGGRALIWDIRRGAPLHAHAPDPVEQAHLGPLRVVSTMPWRWPWGISLTHRIELARAHHPDPGGPVTRRSLDHG